MRKKRIISSVVAIPIVYLFILWGGFAYFMLISAVILAGLVEFYRMLKNKKIPVTPWWGIFISLVLLVNAYIITTGKYITWDKDFYTLIITLTVPGLAVILILKKDIKESVANLSATGLSVFYITWLFIHAIFLRETKPYGYEFTLIAVVCTWLADIGAYFIGMKFGYRRARLHVASPNKSKIGAYGAVICSFLAAVLMKYILKLDFVGIAEIGILGVIIGIMAILGDLTESMIKRSLDCDDSGKFLPGHGGVLDRVDSFMFTIPVVYYYLRWLVV
ncbi:MAG: phosphatidate cytidylyltransferase [Elusimicrobiota bacterium]